MYDLETACFISKAHRDWSLKLLEGVYGQVAGPDLPQCWNISQRDGVKQDSVETETP